MGRQIKNQPKYHFIYGETGKGRWHSMSRNAEPGEGGPEVHFKEVARDPAVAIVEVTFKRSSGDMSGYQYYLPAGDYRRILRVSNKVLSAGKAFNLLRTKAIATFKYDNNKGKFIDIRSIKKSLLHIMVIK